MAPLLTDRTTIVTDWKCRRKRWWYKDYLEKGIVPVEEAAALKAGRFTHEDLANLVSGMPLDGVLANMGEAPLDDSLLLEPWLRRRGWAVAFYRYLLPKLQDQYEFLKVEHELILDRGDLWVAGTPDALARDKTDKRLVKIDWKSVGMLGRGWVTHWRYAVQQMLNAKAVEEEIGEPIKYSLIIGLVKGQERDGKLRHPYVWAYSDGERWSGDWKRDWDLRLTSEYEGGVERWVEALGEEKGLEQFPFSAPIFQDERLLSKLIKQRKWREQEVKDHRAAAQTDEEIRDRYWPHNFEECRPVFGDPCPYQAVCHNAAIEADPIGSGLYVPRTPHHDVELEAGDDE